MAVGFTPKFKQCIELSDYSASNYLVLAIEAVKNLGWDIAYISTTGLIAHIGGGLFSTQEEFKLTIIANQVNIVSSNISSGMTDWGRNKRHVNEFLEKLEATKSAYSLEQLMAEYENLMPSLPAADDDKLLNPPTGREKVKSFFSLFIPRENYFITPIIVDLNIAIYLIMVLYGVNFFLPDTADLLRWGANLRSSTLSGEWWRLLTNIFLHVGIFHLLLNMYALIYIGVLLEPYLGKLRFASAYILTGILASVTSIYWHDMVVSAGASGAIFGMYGVFLAMLTTNVIDKTVRKPLLSSIAVFVIMNLANGLKEGIDNAAHVGGLISGLAIGYVYYLGLIRPAKKIKYATFLASIVITLGAAYFFIKSTNNDFAIYQSKMNDFEQIENSALLAYQHNEGMKDLVVREKFQSGIRFWQSGLQLINDVKMLDLPDELKERNEKLTTYCNLRIKCYQMIVNSINEKSLTKYKTSIDSCNKAIEEIISKLNVK